MSEEKEIKTENRTIYDLSLHAQILIEADGQTGVFARRVPGGWIYSYFDYGSDSITATFVPYNDEYLK